MLIDDNCELCQAGQESTYHLFSTCEYTRWVSKEAMGAAGGLAKLDAISNFEEAAYELNKVARGTPAWGLIWNIYDISLFHIWKQRNQRRITARRESKQVLL